MTQSIATTITTCLSGGLGALMATLCDVMQKEEASAVLKMTQTFDNYLNLVLPPLYVALIIVLFGVALVLIFGTANNHKMAFYTGVGVISMFMTVTPYKEPPSYLPPDSPIGSIAHSSFTFFPSAHADHTTSSDELSTLTLKLDPGQVAVNRSPVESIVALRDDSTGRRIWSGKIAGLKNTLTFAPGTYQISVQTYGFTMQTHTVSLSAGHDKKLIISLSPTKQPNFVQRLLRPGG